MRWRLALSVIFLFSAGSSLAQQPQTETLHVRNVQYKSEPSEKGILTDITATVESKTVRYEITCSEWHGSGRSSSECVHIEAGRDYSARVFPTAIDFWPGGAKAYAVLYSIESESEK